MSSIPPLSKSMLLLLVTGILALTGLTYLPVLDNDFVNFDDTKYLTINPQVKVLSPAAVWEIFTSVRGLLYHYVPLSLLTLAIEHHFFQLDPGIYHLNNLILHLLNTALVFVFIQILLKHWLLAGVVAALFGVHPMHVESVAWVAERKDVLYTFFYLLGLIQYVFYVKSQERRYLLSTLLFFVLSCLSKPMAVTFPAVLLCLDYFYHRLKAGATYIEKIPFVLIAGFFGLLTATPKPFPIIEFDEGFTWFERFLIACYTFSQYIFKAVFPVDLSVFYPYPLRTSEGALPNAYYAAPAVVLLTATLFILCFRNRRVIIFGGLFFLVTIFPVLNFYPLGNMLMADRYSYLSYLGLFIILARCLFLTLENPGFHLDFKIVLILVSLGFLLTYSYRSIRRIDVWQNSETLWTDTVFKYPQEPFSYYNLADHYFSQGQIELAIREYSNAISVDPRYFAAYNNRGNMYVIQERYDLALRDYMKAADINPRHINSRMNIADYHSFFNRHEDAAAALEDVLAIDPGHAEARRKLQQTKRYLEHVEQPAP